MKLFNQFNVLPRYLTAFNYAGLNLNETPKELEKCTPEFQNFWDKECSCLLYTSPSPRDNGRSRMPSSA